jgi:HAMP domain-containing protein
MRIANKIILLIVLLLCLMAASAWIGIRQMGNIRQEFSAMAHYDVTLTASVTTLHQLQLQKNILLQRLIGIAEELGYENLSFARSSYLHDQLLTIREGLKKYSEGGTTETLRAKDLFRQAGGLTSQADQRASIETMLATLERLEKTRRGYDDSLMKMLTAVEAGGFKLSLEDLENIQHQEDDLTAEVEGLLKFVQDFLGSSLARTVKWEASAQRQLWGLLLTSLVLSLALAFWIVRSIVRPLQELSAAVKTIGEGNFRVQVSTASGDELARLGQAFNTMSQKLEEFKLRLEKQNADLRMANADLDHFIHVMGHDIADPLMVMLAYCVYLEGHMGQSMDSKSMESLQGIRKASTKMHAMVQDLMKFAKSKRYVL